MDDRNIDPKSERKYQDAINPIHRAFINIIVNHEYTSRDCVRIGYYTPPPRWIRSVGHLCIESVSLYRTSSKEEQRYPVDVRVVEMSRLLLHEEIHYDGLSGRDRWI